MTIVYSPHDEVKTWYVVIDKLRTFDCRWWHIFTGVRLAHVYVLSEAGENGIIKVEPLAWGLVATYYDIKIEDYLVMLAKSDITALISVTIDYRKVPDVIYRGMYNCVSQVKAVLGIKAPLCLTPRALYKRLIRRNSAIVIKAYTPWVES